MGNPVQDYAKMLDGKVAIITGAGSGMGEATSKLFAEHGAKVVVCDYNIEEGQRVADEIVAAGGEATYFGRTDVTEQQELVDLAAKTAEKYGTVDILCCYAGRTFDGIPGLSDKERLDKTFAVNYYGVYFACFAVLPYMEKQGSGAVMICSSSGAFNPAVPAYEYHTSKGACECFVKQFAFDCGNKGIRVNCMKPGLCITHFYDELPGGAAGPLAGLSLECPMNRPGDPYDFANVALFYCSEMSAYVTGHLMYVGGGMGDILCKEQSGLLRGGTVTARGLEE